MERMVIAGELKMYDDVTGKVRNDGTEHLIRDLVQPDDPEVIEIARVLVQTDDFVRSAHEFVNSFTSYKREIGEFWAKPSEMLDKREGDCDDSSILLCSILRNYIPADQVFIAIGMWDAGKKPDGHAWVVTQAEDGEDELLESTTSPSKSLYGKYTLHAMFNDKFVYATNIGLKEFELKPVGTKEKVLSMEVS